MKRPVLLFGLLLVGLIGGWLFGVRQWYRSVQPAGPTLAEHLAQRPTPEQQRVLAVEGREYLVLFGPIQAIPRFPSGGPVYIFDRTGQMVDWTPDEGDDEAFMQRWPGIFDGRAITMDELASWPGSGR